MYTENRGDNGVKISKKLFYLDNDVGQYVLVGLTIFDDGSIIPDVYMFTKQSEGKKGYSGKIGVSPLIDNLMLYFYNEKKTSPVYDW